MIRIIYIFLINVCLLSFYPQWDIVHMQSSAHVKTIWVSFARYLKDKGYQRDWPSQSYDSLIDLHN